MNLLYAWIIWSATVEQKLWALGKLKKLFSEFFNDDAFLIVLIF